MTLENFILCFSFELHYCTGNDVIAKPAITNSESPWCQFDTVSSWKPQFNVLLLSECNNAGLCLAFYIE